MSVPPETLKSIRSSFVYTYIMHIALVGPELHGHLNPLTTLGNELLTRGHRVTLFGMPAAEPKAKRAGIGFHPIAIADQEQFDVDRIKLAELKGFKALKFTVEMLRNSARVGLRDLPEAFRSEGIDAVLVDQVSPAAATAADVVQKPFIVVCNALALHPEPAIPPGTVTWPYRTGLLARMRNRIGHSLIRYATKPVFDEMATFRSQHNLPQYKRGLREVYGLAHIAQQPEFFDFPRHQLPPHFHYTGPWHRPGRDDVAFPWDKLDGRPLIYASLGTMQNGLQNVFNAILEGCSTLPVQLVLSLGSANAEWKGSTPANAIVVPFAPQLELLKRSTAVITHAGLNTALETLSYGKPMLCLPITNDQPGVANRVNYLNAGEVLKPDRATPARIRTAMERILGNATYRANAEKYRDLVNGVDGLKKAGDIVDKAFTTGQRVDNNQSPHDAD